MIKNLTLTIDRSEVHQLGDLVEWTKRRFGIQAIRWYVSNVNSQQMTLEVTTFDGPKAGNQNANKVLSRSSKAVVVNLIPTGIGCDFGGYAGDAAPVTNLMAGTVDYVITNPNSLNASDFLNRKDNVLYTDGCSIDLFMQESANLFLPYSNRLGVIIERSDEGSLDQVFNVINAVRAVYGVSIVDCIVTDERIGSRCEKRPSGAYSGTVRNPEVILTACGDLVERGANAIAITTNVQDLPVEDYIKHFDGKHPNPVGGVEAIISYVITSSFGLPSAHAPLSNIKGLELRDNVVDARGSAEIASLSGIACVLMGLAKAPQLNEEAAGNVKEVLGLRNVLAVIAPGSCLGGIPMLFAQLRGIPVIAVESNGTVLDVGDHNLNLPSVVKVRSYLEAAGAVQALKEGISIESLRRPMKTIRRAATTKPLLAAHA